MRDGRVRPLQRRCEQLVAELGLARPFSLDQLIQGVAHKRGRPLRVLGHPVQGIEGMPCGVWVPLPTEDVIFLENQTSPVHRDHICLHELSHIICGHVGQAIVGPEYLRKLLPDLAPETVANVLARTSYDSDQEREAEAMATVLGNFITRENGAGLATDDATRDHVLGELAKTLGL